MKGMYNGYRFGGTVTIYNPFSIVNCLATLSLGNFWVGSGATSLIHRICRPEDVVEVITKVISATEERPQLVFKESE